MYLRIFGLLIALSIALYFVVEERERRAANPHGPRWLARVGKGAWRCKWLLAATVIFYGINLARGRDSEESLMLFAVGFGLYIVLTLQAAMVMLPRNDRKN